MYGRRYHGCQVSSTGTKPGTGIYLVPWYSAITRYTSNQVLVPVPVYMLPLLDVTDDGGAYPLVILVAEASSSLRSVSSLACTCRSVGPCLRQWMSQQTSASLPLDGPFDELLALSRLAATLPNLSELHVTSTISVPGDPAAELAAHCCAERLRDCLGQPLPFESKTLLVAEKAITELEDLPMSAELLVASGAGRAVNALRKHLLRSPCDSSGDPLATRAKLLIEQWTALVRTTSSRGCLKCAPLRAAAARGGSLNLASVLSGVSGDQARHTLTALSCSLGRRVAPGVFALDFGRHLVPRMVRCAANQLLCPRVRDSIAAVLSGALCSGALTGLRRLNLSDSAVCDTGLRWLSKAVACGALCQLTYWNLSCNKIGDAGLTALATALTDHSGALAALETLLLSYNPFEAPGLMALARAFSTARPPPPLQELSLRATPTHAALTDLAALVARGALPRLKRLRVDDPPHELKAACVARQVERE